MDYSMPDLDGIETSMQIFDLYKKRGFERDGEKWPFVCCLSAYTD